MKNSSSGRNATHQQQSPTMAFNGRPEQVVGGGNARRTAKINPQSIGPTNSGNSRRQAVAKNFLLHNSIGQMNGKQMEMKKNTTKNFGVKKEGGEEEEKEKSIVGPLDVEEMLWSRQIARSEIRAPNLPPQRLRDMLERDLQLKRRKRAKPFLENGNGRMENDGAERNNKLGQNQVEMDLLDWYGRDSLQITRKWADLSAEANALRMRRQRESMAAELPNHHFEGEHPILFANRNRAQSIGSNSNGTSTASANSMHSFRRPTEREQRTPPANLELLELCETMGEQKLDEIRERARRKVRGKLLANLAIPTSEALNEFGQNGGDEALENKNFWSDQSRLSIQFTRLALIPALEPLFASVALYDIRKRQKLSENFHLNSATLTSSKSTKRALFTLPMAEWDDGMDGLVLVFRFEKGLAKGGLDSALEAYTTTTTKKIQQQQEERPNTELNAVNRSNQFRQQIGLLAIPLARTVANTYFNAGNDQQKRATAGINPRSFTDSFIQTNFVGDEQPFSNSPIHHLAHQHSAPQYSAEDTISESISADRLSCSTIPPAQIRPSNSWARLSAKQSQETLNNNIGHQHQKMPPANFNWANSLRNQPISIRANHFLRSEPLSDTEMFDWLGSNQQRQSREKIPLDFHFELELCQMGELANAGWRVVSPEFRLLNFTQQMDEEKEEWMELLDGAPSAQDLLPFPVTPRLVMPHTFDRHLCYIYPYSVNFSSRIGQKNARNICIRAELFDGQMRRIKGFVNENGTKMDAIHTSVQYHCKQPKFGGIEWKMLLPRNVEGIHLRFTFLHISCKQMDATNKTTTTQMMETPIGYSWLPLHCQQMEENVPIGGDHHLPISLDPLPPAICFLSPNLPFPYIHWLDSHRPLFHLSIQLVSSIQPEDPHLLIFLKNSHKFIENAESISSTELAQSIQNLLKIRPEPMLAFLHVLLHRILAILANCPANDEFIQIAAFDILCQLAKIGTMLLDGRTDKWGRSKILADFIREEAMPKRQNDNKIDENGNLEGNNGQTTMASKQDKQNNNNNGIEKKMATKNGTENVTNNNQAKTTITSPIHLHEQLARMLLHSIGQSQGNNTARDTVCTFCWFPLALIRRAMTEHLIQIEGQLLPRKMRFSPKFIENLGKIGELLIGECLERLPRNFAQSKAISQALAEFLCHSISILSRTFVLEQLKNHCQQMDQRIESLQAMNPTLSGQLLSLKFAFIRTIYSHEHFIFLCLPFADLPKMEEKPVAQKPEESLKRSLTQLNRTRSIRRETSQIMRGGGGMGQTQQKQATKSQSSIHPPKQIEINGPESTLFFDVCAEHSNCHFPISFLLSQIRCLLLSSNSINSSSGATAAIELLHWLISAHENDWRLQDTELRQKMAQIYSPLLGIVLELIGRKEWTTIWMGEQHSGGETDADSGLASASSEESSGDARISSARNTAGNGKEETDERKLAGQKLLLSLSWLLRSLSPQSLLQHFRQFSGTQLCQFVLLLRSLISTFCQSPPAPPNRRNSADSFVHLNLLQIGPILGDEFQQMFSTMEVTTILGTRRQSVETIFSDKCSDKMATVTEEKTTKGSTTMAAGKSSANASGQIVKWRKKAEDVTATEIERHISRHLSTEILLLVLDQLDLLFQIASTTRIPSPTLLSDLLRLLLHILGGHNALASFEHIFRSQRAFIRKFPEFLLETGSNSSIGCSEQLLFTLCLQLLRHMGSEMADVRAQAGLTAFTLLRTGQKLSKSAFIRLSKTFTLALSSYVSNAAASGLTLNDAILRQSLEAILQFRDGNESAVATKKESANNWRTQIEELVANLSAILVDSLKLEACGDDFEMAIDLMLRIAHGYRNNPQLSMAWLMAIARKHLSEERRNNAEAAQCLLHCCVIVADQLASNGAVDDEFLPHSVFQAFEQLSENVREEWAQGKAGRGTMEEKGTIHQEQRISGQFNLKAFGELVEKAAKFFERAQLFELIPTVFKLVFPMHEQMHSNAKLIQLHSQIVDCLSRVEQTSTPQPILWEDKDSARFENFCGFCPSGGDKRCFGTYFRVRFFGTLFGELDGQEFVYKEPAITKLAEISHRIEEFYSNKFGGKNLVKMIKHSNEVDPKKLDPTKAHLQITYVEPHFERWERRNRQTHIQRNYGLKQFIFATPFTLDGKAHGPLKEQHKRKTVLTVENSFPYVKTRLRVIKREQWVLAPIEVALEDVQKRSRELGWAMAARPIDVKMLQMILQGCIGTTVNQGPLEIARVFLAGVPLHSDGLPRDGPQRRLHLAFDELAQKCSDALEMNGQLMEPSREDYQRELRRNMAHFQQTMAQIRAQSIQHQNGMMAAAPSPAELVQALALAGKIGPISTV